MPVGELAAGIKSNEFQALSDAYSDEVRSAMSCRSSPATVNAHVVFHEIFEDGCTSGLGPDAYRGLRPRTTLSASD